MHSMRILEFDIVGLAWQCGGNRAGLAVGVRFHGARQKRAAAATANSSESSVTRRPLRLKRSLWALSVTGSTPVSRLRAPRAASTTHVPACAWNRPSPAANSGAASASRQSRSTWKWKSRAAAARETSSIPTPMKARNRRCRGPMLCSICSMSPFTRNLGARARSLRRRSTAPLCGLFRR